MALQPSGSARVYLESGWSVEYEGSSCSPCHLDIKSSCLLAVEATSTADHRGILVLDINEIFAQLITILRCISVILCFSQTSNGFYSNTHWKCSSVLEPAWYTTRFDDRHWSAAILSPHSSFYDTSDYTDNFNPDAKFIWAEGYDAHDIVYCRARLCYRKQLSNSLN